MTKFGVLGATALSLVIATPVLAQAPAGHPGAHAAGGHFSGARMGSAGPRVQSNFRGTQGNVGAANFAGRGNAQFAQGGYRGGQFRGDRNRGFGRDIGFAAGAAVATGSALALGSYGYNNDGYYDPNYYGDNYAYDNGYDNSYAYDNGATYDTGLPLVAFGQQAPVDQTTVAVGGDASYCAQRYRSYDPASGTYLGYDGLRHPCE